jgi:hypothetical protein
MFDVSHLSLNQASDATMGRTVAMARAGNTVLRKTWRPRLTTS